MTESGQKFAHATTAELLWHVQNSDLIRSPLIMEKHNIFFTRFGLLAPELFVKLVSANERRRYKVTPSLIGWAQT